MKYIRFFLVIATQARTWWIYLLILNIVEFIIDHGFVSVPPDAERVDRVLVMAVAVVLSKIEKEAIA